MEGGKDYFNALNREDSPNKAKEHKTMREYLEYAFGEAIPCCLLPHPGEAICRKTCSIANLKHKFQRETFKLCQNIKNGCEFKIKTIQKSLCRCK